MTKELPLPIAIQWTPLIALSSEANNEFEMMMMMHLQANSFIKSNGREGEKERKSFSFHCIVSIFLRMPTFLFGHHSSLFVSAFSSIFRIYNTFHLIYIPLPLNSFRFIACNRIFLPRKIRAAGVWNYAERKWEKIWITGNESSTDSVQFQKKRKLCCEVHTLHC